MAHIKFDTQRAYKIPDDKRDEYFEIVDQVSSNLGSRLRNAIDTSNDPIVIFDLEYIPTAVWFRISFRLSEIGAENITETLT